MSLHPNTLRYRLDRGGQVTRFDLDDPEEQFRLQLAAQLLGQRRSRPVRDGASSSTAAVRA